jgi:formamidopyrimidine-DNA glycosylase
MRLDRKGKAFFFEKKKQKAFVCLHLKVTGSDA